MIYLQWILLLPLSLLTKPVAWVTSPIVVLFANEAGWLPKWLWWFQTPDNPMDGDLGYYREHAPFTGIGHTGWKRYVNRVVWLWRNSLYGFEISVLGKTLPEHFVVRYTGDRIVKDKPICIPGMCLRKVFFDGKTVYQFFWIKHLIGPYYFDCQSGWKIWEYPTPGNKQYAVRFRIIKR